MPRRRSRPGGELTLFEAVGRRWPDLLLLCRSSPVGDVRRDLIEAWQRPQQALSAERPASAKQAEGKTNRDAIRCLKRHLARRVWNLLHTPIPTTGKPLTQPTS